ncbi:hypothetical protein [Sphingopyxis sp. P8]|uniref:hypothetical protein n=1 Tax=Sphingopyxis sp. P8 TaxID=2763256 RepID=UPI001D0B2161|nr:hypothetical protein [Sphingopyxis sp. P8]
MKLGPAILVVAAVGGCADSGRSEAEEIVRATLTDPESAQFENVARSERNPDVVCGHVNSKNRFGGYVGNKRFYVTLSSREAQLDPGEALSPAAREIFGDMGVVDSVDFDRLYRKHC